MGMRPVRFSRVTQHFGNMPRYGRYGSRSDSHGPAGHHTGIDFGSLWPLPIDGRVVRSSTPGRVVHSSYDAGGFGNYVGVYYGEDDVTIIYAHLRARNVRVGQRVRKGDVLGRVGNTGNSTAPHLHVQANRGSIFSYHDHIAPGKWVRGEAWFRVLQRRLARRRR